MSKFKAGDVVTWGSRPYHEAHTGTVRAVVKRSASIREMKIIHPNATLHAQDWSMNERYLIEVERKHAKTGEPLRSHFYAPNVAVVDRGPS